MLNYKNDSLLLNKETANDLIRDKRTNLIFLDKDMKLLNLFSAFVKKDDFIKTDKIVQPLQKTVYVKVSKNMVKRIDEKYSNRIDLIKRLETYIDRRTSIKETLAKWFNTEIFPFILLRIISKDNKELSDFIKEVEYFTDFLNKSRFYCPKKLDDLLNKKVIYLVGCSVGDGHINKEGKRWTLVDGSSKKERLLHSKEFVSELAYLLRNYLDTYEIREYPTKYALRINNKLFCKFLNFFFGLPFGKKKNIILQKPSILNFDKKDPNKYFWRGCFDTDGSVNNCGAIDFCSSDKKLLTECKDYLEGNNIQVKETKRSIFVGMSDLKKFSFIGFSHPRKQKEYLEILKRGPKFKDIKRRVNSKIDKRLLNIYPLLRIDNNYRIRIHTKTLKNSEFDRERLQKAIKDLFGYEFKESKTGLLYFKSKRVYDHLNENFIFEPYWKPINTKEKDRLLNEWNEVWK
ncbi:LAGLIDADG family homing endonuclease [Nanoarchaeota archaeon]